MDDQKRINLTRVALEALAKTKNPRTYALTAESKNALAVLAAAVYEARTAQGRSFDDEPSPRQEIAALIEKLAAAGVNILQQRPGDAKPLPKPWVDPVTEQALPPPTDLTGKMFLRKYDPALADHYDGMEKDPYAYVQSLREREAQRQALASISYSNTEHAVNPFRGTDMKAQNNLIKSTTPDLVEFYKAEAKEVEISLFGARRNLTVEGRLAKDPSTGALVKIAQRIHEQWRAEEKVVAEEQRAKAELTLKAIEAELTNA
jgi:hypothetical protein